MHDSFTSRRSLLRTVAWTAPAVTVAAATPAFAASTAQPALAYVRTADDAGEIVVTNPTEATVRVDLVFTPTPDEETAWSLVAHSGFEGMSRTSTTPFTLSGTIAAGKQSSGWGWWRTKATENGTTTVQLYVDGTLEDTLTVDLQG